MNKINQIIRCNAEGRGTKQIHSIRGISRNTIKYYLKRFKSTRLALENTPMRDGALVDLIFGNTEPVVDVKRQEEQQPMLPWIVKDRTGAFN